MKSTLPHRDSDVVMMLYAHYFLASELMQKNYRKLKEKSNKHNRICQSDRVNLSIYFCTWLGFLAVTSEGFKKLSMRMLILNERPHDFIELIPKVDELGSLMKKHSNQLRRFRNNIFHLRENHREVEQFLEGQHNRLKWAEELQIVFGEFFSEYRVLCQFYYIIEDRKEEFLM
ncbi:hypothetical protein [Vreelandella neptunia]|uniref:Uncharacterized protein n=1 Tax=Vreelandella neptunia TaxID=115551 RepID=A0ABZ0YJX7_9GAMM|nr:hypothetical protein [Halomonas neptunia]MDN3562631.1 hypothetical protein [Halomonas neptunia]WQH12406.1 hypothetical protein SR894_19990 [Halomonas neptunia]